MSADEDAPRNDGIDGHVEQLDEQLGVWGWAIRRDDPMQVLTIELWAGDRLLAATETGGERPDVSEVLSLAGNPGFRFADNVCEVIRAAADDGIAGDLAVRVSGFDRPLAALVTARSLEMVRMGALGSTPADHDALFERLSRHQRVAQDALAQPYRPLPGRAVGFVEGFAVDDVGVTWIVGWMNDDMVRERPIVVLDNGKHPAGFAYVLIARDDLPPESKGFVGVLHTDWRASTELPPYFFFADGSQRFLESLMPTPIRTKAALAPAVRDLLGRAEGGVRDILRELFHTVHSWAVIDDPDARDLLRVDEVAILPSFGAFVSGWTLSPSKDSERFALKAGNRVMVADERTVSRHTRPDLASVYPNIGPAVERAGFTALFRGDLAGARLDEMVLKTTWNDGSASNEPVHADRVRVLGLTAPIERAAVFYPALEDETFFADFARHAAADARARASRIKPYQVSRAANAIVLAAPATASDIFMMFDAALRHAAVLPADWGIAILARADATRPLVISLFADLKRSSGRPCSLFFTAAAEPSTDALAAVISALGLDRLGYSGPGVVLTEIGWRGASTAAGDGLTLLAVADLASEGGDAICGLDAFACSGDTWQAIAGAVPARIGGGTIEAVPAGIAAERAVVADAAIALKRRRPSPFVARINEIDGRHHG